MPLMARPLLGTRKREKINSTFDPEFFPSGVVASGRETYSIVKTGTTGFTPVGVLKSEAYKEANAFAAKLAELRKSGALTEEEFQLEKKRVLGQ